MSVGGAFAIASYQSGRHVTERVLIETEDGLFRRSPADISRRCQCSPSAWPQILGFGECSTCECCSDPRNKPSPAPVLSCFRLQHDLQPGDASPPLLRARCCPCAYEHVVFGCQGALLVCPRRFSVCHLNAKSGALHTSKMTYIRQPISVSYPPHTHRSRSERGEGRLHVTVHM